MAKRIVVLSDGTGNAAANVWRSNVWRTFELLDLTGADQVARYDDGVGTSAFKLLALLGGAFGWGLKRNVLDLYTFICRHYRADAEIFAFGFSRGAFTVRVLLGLVHNQGLVAAESEAELAWKARAAYRAYRKERYHSVHRLEAIFRALRDAVLAARNRLLGRAPYRRADNRQVETIRFLGVWDTVAAYGLPIEEMTRGVSQWLWPLELPDRRLSDKVRRACHALSLDDERTTFHPLLWTEASEPPPPADDVRPIDRERISQVWFAGAHSNVGGGYPDDSLAQIPLYWMMQEAAAAGLAFKPGPPKTDPDAFLRAKSARDKDGRLYDSRKGLGGYYRYGPRKLQELCHARFSRAKDDAVEIAAPKIHESVFKRIGDRDVYAPIGLPARYAVVDDERRVLQGAANPYESAAEARARATTQESVWDTVWQRRVVYFLTVAASAYLVLFPLWFQTEKSWEFSSPFRLVSETLRLAGSFLPGFARWWIDSFAANPGLFLIGLAAVIGLILLGSRLRLRITDQMLRLWRTPSAAAAPPGGAIYALRTNPAYRWLVWAMKRHAVPLLSALFLLYCGFAVVSHLGFNVLDAAGVYCRGTPPPADAGNLPRPTNQPMTLTARFETKALCWASGVELVEGERYAVTLVRTASDQPWGDGEFAVDDIAGFEISELPSMSDRAKMIGAVPLRRVLQRPWFRPILRIGRAGSDEYFMDPDPETPARKRSPDKIDVSFRSRRTGEMFLYVNDAVLGLPWGAGAFLGNNRGTATVTVQRLSR